MVHAIPYGIVVVIVEVVTMDKSTAVKEEII